MTTPLTIGRLLAARAGLCGPVEAEAIPGTLPVRLSSTIMHNEPSGWLEN